MNEIMPIEVRNNLPEHYQGVKFVKTGKGFWYGVIKRGEAIRVYVDENYKIRIEKAELQQTGQWGVPALVVQAGGLNKVNKKMNDANTYLGNKPVLMWIIVIVVVLLGLGFLSLAK